MICKKQNHIRFANENCFRISLNSWRVPADSYVPWILLYGSEVLTNITDQQLTVPHMRFSGEDCGETLSPEQPLCEKVFSLGISDGYRTSDGTEGTHKLFKYILHFEEHVTRVEGK